MTGAEFDGVDLDLLADYVGGALTGTPDEDRVAALLAGDPAWQTAYELLEPGMAAVGAALREVGPEPMPDDLAARLDAVLRAPMSAVPLPDAATADVDPSAGPAGAGRAEPVPAKVVDLGAARRLRRWAAPIAVAAAVVAFAGFGVSRVAISESAPDNTAPAAGRKVDAGATGAAAPPPEGVTRTGTDYTEATLAQAAAGEAVAGTLGSRSQVPSAAGADPDRGLARLAGTDALAACLEAIARQNGGGAIVVEFVDYARFAGAPALVVRFSAANGIWVWAVGPECGATGMGADVVEQLPVR